MKIFYLICVSIIQFNVPQHSTTLKNKSFNEAGYYTPLDCDYATRFREGIFMKEIKLTQGKIALVDDEDYEMLIQWKWCAACDENCCYAISHDKKTGKTIRMHRVILGLTNPKIFADHIDRNGLNNQRSNLRPCTHSENMKNRIGRGVSKYLGVTLKKTYSKYKSKNNELRIYPHQYWTVQINPNGKGNVYVGQFKSEIEAAKAYDEAAKKYHGEFARLNFTVI